MQQEVKEKFKAVLRPQYASKVDTIEPCRNGIGVDGPSEMSEALTYLNAKRIFKRFSDAKTWP